MKFPDHFIEQLQNTQGFDEEAFAASHQHTIPVSVRNNPRKNIPVALGAEKIPWTTHGYYLPERPSFILDPLWHAGAYYVQEASSMFLEQVMRQGVDLNQSLRVLDLCAAPGGKSTLLQSVLSDESLLVCNEVIQSRVSILRENMIKWGGMNAVVTHNDPADFTDMEGFFDVMVVDAPCSGSGLFRRDPEAMNEWSMSNVKLCAERQQRILADVWDALKEDGILIYSTCSYSSAENESILEWMSDHFQIQSLRVGLSLDWGIEEVMTAKGSYGYRFWPHRIKGEGFFLAVLRKKSPAKESPVRIKKYMPVSVKDKKTAEAFVRSDQSVEWVMQGKFMAAVFPFHYDAIHYLMERLRVRYAGVECGMVMHDRFVPEQPLSVSTFVFPRQELFSLNKEQALAYLRKHDFYPDGMSSGIQWVGYQELGLGWVKCLGNRINNYYPKEWRIKMG